MEWESGIHYLWGVKAEGVALKINLKDAIC